MSRAKTQQLRYWLGRYRAASPSEESHRAKMLALLESDGDVFTRHHFRPGHFTASAFVLSPDRDAILLIHHKKLHRWLQPGGHVEFDDLDLIESARREVEEEVGLRVERPTWRRTPLFDLDVHPIPARKSEPEHAHFDLRFLLQATESHVIHGDEVNDATWVPLDRVHEKESDESVMRAVAKIPGSLELQRQA